MEGDRASGLEVGRFGGISLVSVLVSILGGGGDGGGVWVWSAG